MLIFDAKNGEEYFLIFLMGWLKFTLQQLNRHILGNGKKNILATKKNFAQKII